MSITSQRRLSRASLALVALLVVLSCRGPSSVVEGVASYYHDSLHGNQTANGETYSKWKRTAAHLSLPFDTRVRVTNLDNGKSVWVRINDRGPYVAGRIIDLSRAAARKLDMKESGTAEVRLEIYAYGP